MKKLTPQLLLSKLKRRLGIKSLVLPFTDDDLMDIFYEDTLPTFSIYFPARVPFKVDLGLCKSADKVAVPIAGQKSFHLPLPENLNVIEVEDIEFLDERIGTYWVPPLGAMDAWDLFASEMEQAKLESMMSIPITHQFLEPDILVLDQPACMYNQAVKLNLLVEHSKDLSTLKYSYLDYIMDLFAADAKIALYEDMKHHDKIDTTFNQIDLKIDEWADAKNDRKELIDYWKERFLAHRTRTIFRV